MILFPGKEKMAQMTKSDEKNASAQYIETLKQLARQLFNMSERFDLDIKDVLSDLDYITIAADLHIELEYD